MMRLALLFVLLVVSEMAVATVCADQPPARL